MQKSVDVFFFVKILKIILDFCYKIDFISNNTLNKTEKFSVVSEQTGTQQSYYGLIILVKIFVLIRFSFLNLFQRSKFSFERVGKVFRIPF